MRLRRQTAGAPGPAITFVDVGGTRLRACVEGSGPPLLLINGIGANLEVWDPLKRLLSGRQLISFDAPGTGLSPAPAGRLPMQDLADIVAGLLDELRAAETPGEVWEKIHTAETEMVAAAVR